jgi:hypothetical protein
MAPDQFLKAELLSQRIHILNTYSLSLCPPERWYCFVTLPVVQMAPLFFVSMHFRLAFAHLEVENVACIFMYTVFLINEIENLIFLFQ